MIARFTIMVGRSVMTTAVSTSVNNASMGVATMGKPMPKIPCFFAVPVAPGHISASPLSVQRIARGCGNIGWEYCCHTRELHHCPVSIGPFMSAVL